MFGDGNRDVVKLWKMLDDEKDKRKNFLKFINFCVYVIKSKKKCKFCVKFWKGFIFFIKVNVFLVFNICFSLNKNCYYLSFVY